MSRHTVATTLAFCFLLLAGIAGAAPRSPDARASKPTPTVTAGPIASFAPNSELNIFTIPIAKSALQNGRLEIDARGTLNGKLVGFRLSIGLQEPNDDPGTNEVIFSLPEPEGIDFLGAMSERLKAPIPFGKTPGPLSLSLTVEKGRLEANAGVVQGTLTNLKSNANYGEWDLKLDFARGYLTLSERNKDFRNAFINGFFSSPYGRPQPKRIVPR